MQIILTPLKVPVLPPYLFGSGGGDEDSADRPVQVGRVSGRGEDLPYRVEVWTQDLKSVELTLAMTANGSIGYAAYYEATREYPDRYIVLQHKSRILARWNPPEN